MLCSYLILLLLLFASIILIFGVKNKKAKHLGEEGAPEPDNVAIPNQVPADQQTNRTECPAEKGMVQVPNSEDKESIVLANKFKEYLSAADGVTKRQELELLSASLGWFLRRSMAEMLEVGWQLLSEIERHEMREEFDQFEQNWHKIVGSTPNLALNKFTVCVVYMYVGNYLQFMAMFEQVRERWNEFLVAKRLGDVYHIEHIDCDSIEGIDRAFHGLFQPPKILAINGQNLIKLLQMQNQLLLQFLCNEADMNMVKPTMTKIVNEIYLTLLEDQFPEAIRIDVLMSGPVLVRTQRLLRHHSFSQTFRENFSRLTMAVLIREVRNKAEKITRELGLSLSRRTVQAMCERVREESTLGYQDLSSDSQMCVLIKMVSFMATFNTKNVHKLTEKSVKKWRAEECGKIEVQESTTKEFREGMYGTLLKKLMEEVVVYAPEKMAKLLETPGAKTRMLLLLGSRERKEELVRGDSTLIEVYREPVLVDDTHLWDHYTVVLQNDPIWQHSFKLGADVIVFLRWVKRELGQLYDRIRAFVGEEIYDPLFDQNEADLKESEMMLHKMIWKTKEFAEKKNEQQQQKNVFKKWKEMIWQQKTDQLGEKEMSEIAEWIQKLHWAEFTRLLQKGHVINFLEILGSQGPGKMLDNLRNFHNDNAIERIFTEYIADSGHFFKHRLLFPYGNAPYGIMQIHLKITDEEDDEEEDDDEHRDKQVEKDEGEELYRKIAKEDEKNVAGSSIFAQIFQKNNQQRIDDDDDDDVKEKETVYYSYIECPSKKVTPTELKELDEQIHGKTSLTQILVELFISFLSAEPSANPDSELLIEIELATINWFQLATIQQLLNYAEGLEPIGSPFELALRELKREFDHLLVGVKSVREAMFLLYNFFNDFMRNKTLMDNNEEWKRKVRKTWVGGLLGMIDPPANGAKSEYSEDRANLIYAALTLINKNKDMTFYCISNLIGMFNQFQGLFCNLSEREKMNEAKRRLAMLIGDKYLVQLDEMFPQVMQIDLLVPSTRVPLYKYFLSQRSGTVRAQLDEVRLVLPVLLQLVKYHIIKIPATVDLKVRVAFVEKLRQIQREVHPGLVGDKKRMQNLCILQNFFADIGRSKGKIEVKKEQMPVKSIMGWTYGERCMEEKEQKLAFQEQRFEFGNAHYSDLVFFLKKDLGQFKQFIRENRGIRTRIRKLIGEERYGIMLKHYPSELRNPKVFDDSQLLEDYSDALFGEEKATRVIGGLSALINVWVGWMDHQVSENNPKRTFGLRKLHQMVWSREGREYFVEMYDELADEGLDELEQRSNLLREMIMGIRGFVKKIGRGSTRSEIGRRAGKNGTKVENLVKEWNQMVRKARKRAEEEVQGMEEDPELDGWIQQLHWQRLLKVLKKDKQVQGTFVNDLKKDAVARGRLTGIISKKEIEELEKLLNLETEKEFENGIRELEEKSEKELEQAEEEKEEKGAKDKEEEKKEKDEAWERNMNELIREEEQMKKLKRKMEEMQVEKQKKRAEQRQREIERQRMKERDQIAQRNQRSKPERISAGEEECQSGKASGKECPLAVDSPTITITTVSLEEEEELAGSSLNLVNKTPITVKKWPPVARPLDKDLQNELSNVQMKSFIDDEFLHTKYHEFLGNPCDSKRKLVDLGVYVNELWHRMEIMEIRNNYAKNNEKEMEEFGIGIGTNEYLEMRREWEEMEAELDKKEIRNESEFEGIQMKMHGILKRMVKVIEGKENGVEKERKDTVEKEINDSDIKEKEANSVKVQLHKNNLARAIIWKGQEEEGEVVNNYWPKMSATQQNSALSILFNRISSKSNLVNRFNDHLERWRSLERQQKIDRELYNQLKLMEWPLKEGATMFPVQYAQQLYFLDSTDYKHEELLHEILAENGYIEDEAAEQTLKEVKDIVSEWSNGDARLLVTGSYLLGAHTQNSDIDAICVVPQKSNDIRIEMQKFYGGRVNCDFSLKPEQRVCHDYSLYCRLCRDPRVEVLTRIPSLHIPLIEFRLFGIDFDISFVIIPGIDKLQEEPLEPAEVQWMMEVLASQREPQEVMLKALSGHLANIRLTNLMKENKCFTKFRFLLLLLKLWANNNQIYGGIFGFFNGITLSVLAAKVVLFHPHASVPFLLQQFFFIFTTWDWPLPVKIEENSEVIFEPFGWNPSKETNILMPIITPSSLTQNAAFNINKSTYQIIQKEFRGALIGLRKLRNCTTHQPNKDEWRRLFPTDHFAEKYRHFVLITCVVAFSQHIDGFCGFVERKIRLQLLQFDQIAGNTVEYSHVKPPYKEPGTNQCPEMILNSGKNIQQFRAPYCKTWLVGLKMRGDLNYNSDLVRDKKWCQKFDEQLAKEFDDKIFEEYNEKVLKGWYQNIKLESRYIGQSEVQG